jgi:hypothetical protein
MQSDEYRMRNEKKALLIVIHHSSFCILHFFFILSILSILFESAFSYLIAQAQ